MRPTILELMASEAARDGVRLSGWVRTRRDAKEFSFLEVNDGSSLKGIHVLPQMTTGAAVTIEGALVASQGKEQKWEVRASRVTLLGGADESYPLQKKGHTLEFLRSIAHLRARSNLFGAVFRVRSRLAWAVHQFFQERQFAHIHTPIITSSDCEGAGEMFRLTTSSDPKATDEFFGKPAFLTVSGQLEGEVMACALGRIYTFGPTFRAENSNTSRHAAEFWMIEPEVAFHDLNDNMDLAEAHIKAMVTTALRDCAEDLAFFAKFVDRDLMARLESILAAPFVRISYREAIAALQASGAKFEYPVTDGAHLQSEHERWLTEQHFHGPVIVYNYPRAIKPFYMRQNDDGETVAAMDVLVPGIGELVGGSQREERLDRLEAAMQHHGLKSEDYWWYLDLRRFGSVPHAGYGLGFERLLMLVTGVANIRDVIPFARTPGNAEF
jgi:asparaginyl-tRNA synthetase